MAYRSRFNVNDPRFQVALRNVSKGNKAIQGASAEERGLYSSYGETEGSRLSGLESFGRRLKTAEKNLEVEKDFNKQRIGLGKGSLAIRKRSYSAEKDRLRDATIGSLLGLGIGAADVGLNIYNLKQARKDQEKQEAWDNLMLRRWVSDNLPQAYSYGSRFSELGLSSYLPKIQPTIAGRRGHEAFRLSKY